MRSLLQPNRAKRPLRLALVAVLLPLVCWLLFSVGSAQAWTTITVDGANHYLYNVSCASTSLCVAVDSAGNVVTTADPADGAGAVWTLANVDGGNWLFGISCPSTTLCVATDIAGNVVTLSLIHI